MGLPSVLCQISFLHRNATGLCHSNLYCYLFSISDTYKGFAVSPTPEAYGMIVLLSKEFQESKCPHGWVPHVEFCYGFFDFPKTHWMPFPPKCATHNAVLAMPKTEEELGFITSHLRDRGTLDTAYHIGLNKRKDTWNWVDDNPFNMDSNYNDLDIAAIGDSNCGMIEKGHIKATKCDKTRPYVCEIKRGKL